jgi:GNAT superfamily N-acetyltransferase
MKNSLQFRLATIKDLSEIVKMLSDDKLGLQREKFESLLSENYIKAFESIENDPNQELTIVEMNGNIVGTFQLTFIQYLTHTGGLRAQVEAVRTHSSFRGKGIGTAMFKYIIERAKSKDCKIVQLTTDKKRPEAIDFYQNLGFSATHEGMKLFI